MIKREIGHSGLFVNPVGLGCMGLSEFYGPAVTVEAGVSLLHSAIDEGVNHFDTAELYGMGANERLLGEAFHDRRDKVIIATKFGPTRDPKTGAMTGVDGSEKNMRRAVEQSLKHLRTDYIDLYYLHRVDLDTPIEETVGAMAKLVDEGKVRALGLSEASGATLVKANAVHPIAALQSEYSIFSRDIEDTQLGGVREIGASLVAYSPLGRGMLTGAFTRDHKPADGDFRRGQFQPRFAEGAYEANLDLVEEVKAVADALGATPSQVALAWVLGRGEDILTIPGTTKLANLETNLGALELRLTDNQTERLNALADKVSGARYPSARSANINA
ncbi:aldo/keto reductase [Maricaulis parjimensis]|uniref:aldo/keto reductase n=1 Tax=Maricaulis parjimensis TaxID=144023 RepID=UPI00193A55C0|nr:aldo/keto reductase [Maricaulis parjimensis]